MDKSKKLPDEIIDQINAGKLYVSIDGGEAHRANIVCIGGNLAYKTTDSDGNERTFRTDRKVDIWHPVTMAEFVGGSLLSSQSLVDHTININSKDFD